MEQLTVESETLEAQLLALPAGETGRQLHEFAARLYPLCRSITGAGIRQTLAEIQKRIPLEIRSVPTGTAVFDWTVPREWNIRDAYIQVVSGDSSGHRIVDFQKSNLHVMNYSVPIHRRMSLGELRPHLFSIPEQPDWIPYRTSYYQENWGFCLPDRQLQRLPEGEYDVCIDATLEDGALHYGEYFLPGESEDEVLFSCHACHPSLANDNLSGLAVATRLAQLLGAQKRHYSYRFLFLPGTIGAITWLAQNRARAERIKHGLVLTCIGDKGVFHYKKSRRGNAEIDRAATHVLHHLNPASEVLDFSPYGYDERQYCSPGFNLAVGCLMRSVWGTFPEYHTSADNLDFIQPLALAESLRACAAIVDVLENNLLYQSQNPFCEPQLGKRGLYRATGGEGPGDQISARLWVLNLADGQHSLLDMAERSGLPFSTLLSAAKLLFSNGLLTKESRGGKPPLG